MSGNRQSALSGAVAQTKPLLLRFVVGFDDALATRQAPGLPNHFAWNLGHLALTMHRAIEKLDGSVPPASDFVEGNGQSGDARRFDAASVSFGSDPTDNRAIYPGVARSIEVFGAAVDRLSARVARATDAELEKKIAWGAGETPWGDLVGRLVFHNGVHTGQIMDLRRALGMKGVLG